ncbi:hypothetical protein D3C81_1780670 [compost metagenome]
MGVDSGGGGQHRSLPVTADTAQLDAQRQANLAMSLGGVGHLPQARPKGKRRGMHKGQRHVAVRAAAAPVHQAGFG